MFTIAELEDVIPLVRASVPPTPQYGWPLLKVRVAPGKSRARRRRWRSMIRQRVHAGVKRAVAQGKQLGRPRIDAVLEKRIQAQLRTGKGMLKIARELGVGSGTVQRIKQEMKGPFVGVAA